MERRLQEQAAEQYVRRIPNEAKRNYAAEYMGWLLGRCDEPIRPGDLTYMEAQTVRLQLERLLSQKATRNAAHS
jgi:hypothetical protein